MTATVAPHGARRQAFSRRPELARPTRARLAQAGHSSLPQSPAHAASMQLTTALTSLQVMRLTQPMQQVPVQAGWIPSGVHLLSMQLSDGMQNAPKAQAS